MTVTVEEEIQSKGLTAPRITPDHIEETIEGCEFFQLTDVLTLCVLTLVNGFSVTGESACASPENFDQELGQSIARRNAAAKIWALEGYLLKQRLHDTINAAGSMTFGDALKALRDGLSVQREGWNGKGIFITLQVPDDHSKMSSPYIFIDTTGLESHNPAAPRSRVPWLASQTDMLAKDWLVTPGLRRK